MCTKARRLMKVRHITRKLSARYFKNYTSRNTINFLVILLVTSKHLVCFWFCEVPDSLFFSTITKIPYQIQKFHPWQSILLCQAWNNTHLIRITPKIERNTPKSNETRNAPKHENPKYRPARRDPMNQNSIDPMPCGMLPNISLTATTISASARWFKPWIRFQIWVTSSPLVPPDGFQLLSDAAMVY